METLMRRIIGTCTTLLFLFATVVAFPQEPEPEKERRKPAQEEPKKPAAPAEKEKPPTPPPPKPKTSEQPKRTEKKEKSSSGRASSEKTKHGGRRIPDPQFQSRFGRQHALHVQRTDGRSFQTGGFVFEVVEVWPADWIFDDECYIDFIDDDYYLVDVVHPEHRIIIIVVD
jgi:hypothetical protein